MRTLQSFSLMVLAALTVFAATPAKATILLEPYLGYQIGTYTSGSNSPSIDLTGVPVGVRLAYEFPVIFVGVDYDTLVSGTAKQNNTSVDLSGSNFMVEVGAQLPLVRAYVGYAISHDLTFKNSPASAKYEGGADFKLGIGTTIVPMLAINLEYLNSTYDKVNGNSFPAGVASDKSNIYRLTVSVPFTF